jgi:hypothetical protein
MVREYKAGGLCDAAVLIDLAMVLVLYWPPLYSLAYASMSATVVGFNCLDSK